jgi:replicative DNA helicase
MWIHHAPPPSVNHGLTFAMNIAENAAIDDGKIVAIFSLEMSSDALLQRLLCSRAIVDAQELRTGSLWGDDMKKTVRAMEDISLSEMQPGLEGLYKENAPRL